MCSEGTDYESLLQKHSWNGIDFYMKREDLLRPGGGNKVRRFKSIYDTRPRLKKLIALSDPGSHTFLVARHFLRTNQKLILLERQIPLTDYARKNQEMYLNHPRIKVVRENFWKLWLVWFYYKYLSFSHDIYTMGIGGQTNDKSPSHLALKECELQLKQFGEEGRVCHLHPTASGQMLDGFLSREKSIRFNHSYSAVMTGAPISHHFLKWKYKTQKAVRLKESVNITKETVEKAESFYDATGVWLDPNHTVHLLHELRSMGREKGKTTIVLWVTSPYQKEKPCYKIEEKNELK